MRFFVAWFLWKFGGASVTCEEDGGSSGGGSGGGGSGGGSGVGGSGGGGIGDGGGSGSSGDTAVAIVETRVYTYNPPTDEKLAQLAAEPDNFLTDANVSGYLRAIVRFGRRKKDPGSSLVTPDADGSWGVVTPTILLGNRKMLQQLRSMDEREFSEEPVSGIPSVVKMTAAVDVLNSAFSHVEGRSGLGQKNIDHEFYAATHAKWIAALYEVYGQDFGSKLVTAEAQSSSRKKRRKKAAGSNSIQKL
jgi:hypothetical protein